jgi:hypothetical protein
MFGLGSLPRSAARSFLFRRPLSLVGSPAVALPRAPSGYSKHHVAERGSRLLRPKTALTSGAALFIAHLNNLLCFLGVAAAPPAEEGNLHK